MEWMKLLYVLVAALIGFMLYQYIKHNPQALSKENLSKSFFTLGILALLLIGFIALLVMMVRN